MQTIAEYRNQSLASWLSGGEQTTTPNLAWNYGSPQAAPATTMPEVPQADVSSTVQPIQQPQPQQRQSQMNPQGNSNMLRQLLSTGGASGGALTTTQATTAGGGLASSSGGIGVASVPGGVGNAAVAGGTTATGAGGAAGGGAAAGGGFGGGMAAAGPYAALAALVVGGKAAQRSQGSSSAGRALHGAFLPSISQYATDIKKGNWKGVGASVIGLPFLNAWLSSDEAVEKDPEWWPLIDSFKGGG